MTTTLELDLSAFAGVPRLADWLGVWAMEGAAAESLLDMVRGLDLVAHFASLGQRRPATDGGYDTVETERGRIAIISVVGEMMKSASSTGGTSTVAVRKQLRAARVAEGVTGILLRIDSPGGTVAGTDLLAREVSESRRYVPVLAQIEDVGASAAYWVASQATGVYASTPTALVGSIGALMVFRVSKPGKLAVFRSGPLKAAGAGEITPEQAAHLQGLVDDIQQHFNKAVETGRRMTTQQLASVTSGAVWTAEAAMALRLIDGIQPVEATLEKLARMR